MELNQEHHKLVLEKTYSTGAEEWHCPTCGRRFVMTWSPSFKRIILESGDEYAVHSGGKGIPGMVVPQLGIGWSRLASTTFGMIRTNKPEVDGHLLMR
jgi:hypothetical protein